MGKKITNQLNRIVYIQHLLLQTWYFVIMLALKANIKTKTQQVVWNHTFKCDLHWSWNSISIINFILKKQDMLQKIKKKICLSIWTFFFKGVEKGTQKIALFIHLFACLILLKDPFLVIILVSCALLWWAYIQRRKTTPWMGEPIVA